MGEYEQVLRNKKQIFVNNFLGGIAWGLGATLGLSLIIALLTLVFRYIDLVPFIGSFVSDVIKFVFDKDPNLLIK